MFSIVRGGHSLFNRHRVDQVSCGVPSRSIRMTVLNDTVERRRVLRRRLLQWAIVAIAAGLVAASSTFLSAVLPKRDPYRVLFTELAQTHFRATSTRPSSKSIRTFKAGSSTSTTSAMPVAVRRLSIYPRLAGSDPTPTCPAGFDTLKWFAMIAMI